ncbi:invasion associated locus B family protein [Paracoccus sp. S3-43]|uniref:invasion associated locus B family protein n=1 Tax=Paracoccus sp. S3-43 TaxID=3030011 RepID=UPI0023AEF8B0|nr:invasion associated locus B family protein [Paracoccus sp. S3-43]WEF23279.1 invasion associated locus B family protein [Paracoccus sp. S3-43]
MPIKPSQAVLAALALIAAPAFAQDSTAPAATPAPAAETPAAEAPAADAPAAPEAPAAPAPAADAATTGAPATDAPAPDASTTDAPAAAPAADAGPQVGQYYAKETHQDWTTRCIKAEQGKDPCELYQLLKDGEGNSVAEMTLIPLRNGEVAAGATLIAPLETDLIQGLGFAVGTAEPRGYPFNFCAPVGCVSRMGFTAAELDALKRGANATVTLLPFGGDRENPVRLTLSLSGFTAAFDALAAYADEPAPAAAPAPAAETPPAAEAPAN